MAVWVKQKESENPHTDSLTDTHPGLQQRFGDSGDARDIWGKTELHSVGARDRETAYIAFLWGPFWGSLQVTILPSLPHTANSEAALVW